MTRPRFGAPHVLRLLAVGLILAALASTATPTSSQPKVVPKGKLVLAWHVGIASRWLDPQEHDGTATTDRPNDEMT